MKNTNGTNHKVILSGVALTIILTLLCQCTYKDKSESKFVKAEQFADSLIAVLPLESKISLLHGMGGGNSEFGDLDVRFFGIKGDKQYNIPPFYMGHGITGVRSGRDTSIHATYFCTPIAMGCSWDDKLYAQTGKAIAKEMRALGQDLNLGPTLNIIKHPNGGRNWESFSEDPLLTSKMGVAVVKAMQSSGIVCGPKHFVANNQEHNRFDINNEVDERTLREIYLPAFKAAVVEGGALNIMGAYNRLNGNFMCHNKYLLTDILREEWGFQGFVLSDFANGVRNTAEPVKARMNVEMHRPQHYGHGMMEAIKNGQITESQVNTLLKDVLKVMYTMNLFNRERFENRGIVHSKKHIELCRTIAQQSAVLLKNEKAILPLNANNVKSIAVIGPNAKRFADMPKNHANYAYYLQGGGSGRTYYKHDAIIEPYQGILNVFGASASITYAQGCKTPYFYRNNKVAEFNQPEKQLIEEAVAKAKKSEIAIVYAGQSGFNETEGWDRESTKLPGLQDKLINAVAKVNPNTIVVLIAGSYIDMESWIDNVNTVLFVPYCGEQIGNGIADILTGKVSPSGKLPFTWVNSASDYPQNSIFKGKGYSEEGVSNVYSEGIFVGYRYFDKNNLKVRYPFGYGLSYANFEYSSLKISQNSWPVKIEVEITNTSNIEGAEIAQLYIADPVSTIQKANKELKAFEKVSLKPGETKKVKFELNKQDFSHYDVEKKAWQIESGEFIIAVGANSRDLKNTKSIEL